MSIPYFGKEFTFTQPDGTQFQVKGFGNQERAVFETLDGFTVVKDPDSGFFEYATVTEDGRDLVPTGYQPETVNPSDLGIAPNLRAASTSSSEEMSSELGEYKTRWETRRDMQRAAVESDDVMLAPPQRPTTGEFVGLCLLIDFPDVPATIPREEVERYCNQPGYNGFGNSGSVFDYFFDNSRGKLHYTNIVAPYYTARNNRSYYADETQPYPRRAQELVREALDALRAQNFDFSPLTTDFQDFVFATNIFYAGGLVNNWSKGLWPHSSRLSGDYVLMPGKIAADYQITNIGSELTLGTFCHENGHMICDFPDLYDYRRDGVYSHGVGSFCLMCAGANVNEKNPTQVGAYLKFRAGWADSVNDITAGLNATVRSTANEFFIRRKTQREYFIIENRQRTGRDASLPASGLAIWHIDEAGSNENQNMTPTSHYECSLVQADGEFDLERAAMNGVFGDSTDLFHAAGNSRFNDTTTPHSNWWNGTSSGLSISDISNSGPTMTFTSNS